MRMNENPLHKENIELLFHASKVAKILRKPPGELALEEKEERIKKFESHGNDYKLNNSKV